MINSIAVNRQAAPIALTNGALREAHAEIRIWTAALLVSAASALFAGVGGILISSLALWRASGTVLTFVCLGLLFYSAHCMDRIGRARKRIKLVEYSMTVDSESERLTL